MKAYIVMEDEADGHVGMNVVFEGGFDNTSQAHLGIHKLLRTIDSMGIEVKEQVVVPADPPRPALTVVGGTVEDRQAAQDELQAQEGRIAHG